MLKQLIETYNFPDKAMYTVAETAFVLGVTSRHVRYLCRTGKLHAVKVLGRWRGITRGSIEAALAGGARWA